MDSTPLLTLADEPTNMEDSFTSAISYGGMNKSVASVRNDDKVERLEREMTGISRRLDQEVAARKKLQDVLIQAGVNLPTDLGVCD